MVNGKAKGSQYERDVCKMLSLWVSSNTQEDVFWRSALSGGRATVAFKSGKRLANQAGDLSCIDPIGQHFINRFAVECKFYLDLNYQGLITGKGKLLEFWKEINTQAVRYEKYPFLVAKQNRMPAMIGLNRRGLLCLGLNTQVATLICPPRGLYLICATTFVKVCKPYVHPS